MPSSWSAGLGWGAEHLEETVGEVLEATVLERRGEEEERVEEHRELARALRREQRQSSRFEAMLEEAVRGEVRTVLPRPIAGGEEQVEGQEEEHEEEEEEARTEFVPIISYISPSLGRLVSPLKVLTRQESLATGRAPRHSTPRGRAPAKRKLEEGGEGERAARLPRAEADSRLGSLRQAIARDMQEDRAFEARLQQALDS